MWEYGSKRRRGKEGRIDQVWKPLPLAHRRRQASTIHTYTDTRKWEELPGINHGNKSLLTSPPPLPPLVCIPVFPPQRVGRGSHK